MTSPFTFFWEASSPPLLQEEEADLQHYLTLMRDQITDYFILKVQVTHQTCWTHHQQPQSHPPVLGAIYSFESSILIQAQEFLQNGSSHMQMHFPEAIIPIALIHNMMPDIISYAKAIIQTRPSGFLYERPDFRLFSLYLDIIIQNPILYVDDLNIQNLSLEVDDYGNMITDLIIEESMEDPNNIKMVPASKNAIESLERVKLENNYHLAERCSICLTEFDYDDDTEQVSSMPLITNNLSSNGAAKTALLAQTPRSPPPPRTFSTIPLPPPTPPSLSLLADQCTTIHHLKQIHNASAKTPSPPAASSPPALSPFADLTLASRIFSSHTHPTPSCGTPSSAPTPLAPIPITLSAFTSPRGSYALFPGNTPSPFSLRPALTFPPCQTVPSGLVRGYSVSGDFARARLMFDEMPDRSLSLWTTMVCGYAQNQCYDEALGLFDEMIEDGLEPNAATLASVSSACARAGLRLSIYWLTSKTLTKGGCSCGLTYSMEVIPNRTIQQPKSKNSLPTLTKTDRKSKDSVWKGESHDWRV
ncbi:hypothetical protein HN873_033448 [Arachis hypogaea]